MKKQHFRHGDVILHPVNRIDGIKQQHRGKYVLALGEATGHMHTLMADQMTILKKGNRNMIELQEEAQLVHQEHKPLNIFPQKYVQVQEREMDHFINVVRKVVD